MIRADHRAILDIVEAGSRVLDLGCGEGELLAALKSQRNVIGQGIELNEEAIYRCVEKGLSVYHGDIDSGLPDYPDGSFDYVILNQSLQEVRNVAPALREVSRVGRRVIVGISNFAHIEARCRLFFRGRTPVTPSLPHRWYDTPNLRFQTLADFRRFCHDGGFAIERVSYPGIGRLFGLWPNLLAPQAIFLLGPKFKA